MKEFPQTTQDRFVFEVKTGYLYSQDDFRASDKRAMRQRKANLKRMTGLFADNNSIEESFNIARGLVKEAKTRLDIFHDSRCKKAILAMSDYTLQRNK